VASIAASPLPLSVAWPLGPRTLARARPWGDPRTISGTLVNGALTVNDLGTGLERADGAGTG
jgi:hypothetical protein